MGLYFHSDDYLLVLHRNKRILPCSEKVEGVLQGALLKAGYPQSFVKGLAVVNADEACVIIQTPYNSEQDICCENLCDEIRRIVTDSYGWDSLIILTTNEV